MDILVNNIYYNCNAYRCIIGLFYKVSFAKIAPISIEIITPIMITNFTSLLSPILAFFDFISKLFILE